MRRDEGWANDARGGVTPRRRWAVLLTAATLAVALVGPAVSSAGAQSTGLDFEAWLDDQPVRGADANDPLELRPEDAELRLTVTNNGSTSETIRYVVLEGRAIGINFFSYSTRVGLEVEPGETTELSFLLDLGLIGEQATGLLPSEVALLDEDRDTLVSHGLVADVRGSVMSVYGLFALGVLLVTVLLTATALVRLAANRLPTIRWRRGAYFAVPGVGWGLSITFGLSLLRYLSPSPGVWWTLILACGAVGFGLGVLSRDPAESDVELADDELLDLAEMEAALVAGSDHATAEADQADATAPEDTLDEQRTVDGLTPAAPPGSRNDEPGS